MSQRILINNPPQTGNFVDDSQKLLQILTTEPNSVSEFTGFVAPTNNMVIGNESRYAYAAHVIPPYERENWWIPMDHCYARPWNWRPESTFLRPTKTLFIPKTVLTKRRSVNPLAPIQELDDMIDVEVLSEAPSLIYDKTKAKELMEECEEQVHLARIDEGDDDWEEHIERIGWTATQSRLFSGMANILNMHHLAKLAYTDTYNEPVCRRVSIDKSVERVRKLMATIVWDVKYTQWIHQLLIDNLSASYLASYFDILQTLRSKLPTFVDKMMFGTNPNRLSLLGYENVFPLMKKPWDPVALSLMQDKPKKLPGNPVIVVVPSTPISSKRMLKWINSLSSLATVITIPSNYGGTNHKTAMMSCVDQMFVMSRNKIQDIRLDYPGRNIVLVGFGFGATLALQLAQVEQVLCVVSIGFSLFTAEGKRGEADDNLLELQCPVLFVIGQCSSTSLQEDMEDLRERMRVETGLIVVGSADDNLRVSKKKKKAEGITQSVVDRCVIDEIGEFVSGVILSPFPPQIRQSPTNLTTEGMSTKKMKTERKRYNSNTSSVDSEPPSPTPRISRPGQNNSSSFGRPPGSKGKNKWNQGIPSSPNSSPPHFSTLHTPDTSSNDSNITLNSDTPHPVKKIKTLKPTVSTIDKKSNSNASTPQTAKVIDLQNRSFSGLADRDFQALIQPSTVKSGPSGIRVLENFKLTSGLNTKMLQNNSNVSKLSIVNPKTSNGNSIVLLPDGKIKSIGANVKASGNSRYITSKRQLLGSRPPRPVKKLTYFPQSSLAPPQSLTTQDILDLPIIFADDNQILDNSLTQSEAQPFAQIVTSSSNLGNKFMVINKPQNLFVSQCPKPLNLPQASKTQPKYTKIIVSSKKGSETSTFKKLEPHDFSKPPEISTSEQMDLESEITANTLYKAKSEKKGEVGTKRKAEDAEITDEGPGKTLKLEN